MVILKDQSINFINKLKSEIKPNYALNLKKHPLWITSLLSFIPNEYVLQLYEMLKISEGVDSASLLCFHYNALIKLNIDFNELDYNSPSGVKLFTKKTFDNELLKSKITIILKLL